MAAPYLLGMYEKAVPAELSWLERLEAARASGFDYVELSVDETRERMERLDWTPAERRELIRMQVRTGVPVRSLCLSAHRSRPLGSSDPEARAESLKIAEKAVGLASDLGIRTLQLAGYDVYYEPSTPDTRKWFTEGLAKVVEMAARQGVLLGFETMETPFMDTVEKAMEYVDLIGSPYLGVYPDLGNLSNAALLYGGSVASDIDLGRGHIVAAHCKETKAGCYRDMAFGTGTTDYDDGLDELVAQGVRRYVAEFWYLGSPDWRGDTSASARFVREKLDAAFARASAAGSGCATAGAR